MTFVFEFSEADTETLRRLLRDCVGVNSYASLTAQFFSQLSEQERRQRKVQLPSSADVFADLAKLVDDSYLDVDSPTHFLKKLREECSQ